MRIDETRGTQQAEVAEDEGAMAEAATQVEEGLPSWERPPTPPRVYLASLTDYNAGVLHGKWVDADHPAEILGEVAQEMLAESPTAASYGETAEEWAVHDFEGFGNVRLREYESLDEISELAQGIVEHGGAFGVWWEDIRDMAPEDDPDHTFEHRFEGEFSSTTEWAESMLDDMGVSLDY